jgi:23S rRNA (adenine2030-N6)-methyltransferase
MVLVEAHAPEARSLRNSLGRLKLLSVIEGDGFASIKAHTPPREHRGLVLMDPPYESEAEFDSVLAALETGHERWPTGTYCVWYPLTERAGALRFQRSLERSSLRKVLACTLSVMPADTPVGLRGSGLVLVNPPWQLDERLAELLPDLHRLLVPEGVGGATVDWWVGER